MYVNSLVGILSFLNSPFLISPLNVLLYPHIHVLFICFSLRPTYEGQHAYCSCEIEWSQFVLYVLSISTFSMFQPKMFQRLKSTSVLIGSADGVKAFSFCSSLEYCDRLMEDVIGSSVSQSKWRKWQNLGPLGILICLKFLALHLSLGSSREWRPMCLRSSSLLTGLRRSWCPFVDSRRLQRELYVRLQSFALCRLLETWVCLFFTVTRCLIVRPHPQKILKYCST